MCDLNKDKVFSVAHPPDMHPCPAGTGSPTAFLPLAQAKHHPCKVTAQQLYLPLPSSTNGRWAGVTQPFLHPLLAAKSIWGC